MADLETLSSVSVTALADKTKSASRTYDLRGAVDDLCTRIKKTEDRIICMEKSIADLEGKMKSAFKSVDGLCQKLEIKEEKVPLWVKPHLEEELREKMELRSVLQDILGHREC